MVKMNNTIKEKWNIALKHLDPTQAELEHGLELHRGSIVCDTYGFAPISPIDGDLLAKKAKKGVSARLFVDMKEEMEMLGHCENKSLQTEFAQLWEQAGVTCIFQNAGEEGQAIKRLIKRLGRFTYIVDAMPDFFKRAAFPEDIERAKTNNNHCLYMSGNGVPLVEDFDRLEDELAYIRTFFQLGVRMMHLTYNRRNMIGDGCGEASNAGLSDFGRAVVAEMNHVGVIVDVAHCGQQTSLDAATISSVPIVASHSGVMSVNKHYRCKADDIIKAIADTDGYVGICCISQFLGINGDINALMQHIDYIVRTFGPEHVTIGTDTVATLTGYYNELAKIESCRPDENRWASLWPPHGQSALITDESLKSLAWTNWPLFTVGLVKLGYSDTNIQKIIGGNMLRVAKAVLPYNPNT